MERKEHLIRDPISKCNEERGQCICFSSFNKWHETQAPSHAQNSQNLALFLLASPLSPAIGLHDLRPIHKRKLQLLVVNLGFLELSWETND
ncbi:hypothetical protein AKJ16_DCAP05204 [Drosera capensis]